MGQHVDHLVRYIIHRGVLTCVLHCMCYPLHLESRHLSPSQHDTFWIFVSAILTSCLLSLGFSWVFNLASIPDFLSGRLPLKRVIRNRCPLMINVTEKVVEGSGEYIQHFSIRDLLTYQLIIRKLVDQVLSISKMPVFPPSTPCFQKMLI